MPTATDLPSENIADREIFSSRVFEFPSERLFEAFRDPSQLEHWWGPNGFTNSFEEFDLRPGGHWRFVMHGPDGTNYKNESTFVEVTPGKRVVIDHVSNPKFRMTITFENVGGKTKLGWRMLFETAAICAAVKKIVPDANEQNFDRLQALLLKMNQRH